MFACMENQAMLQGGTEKILLLHDGVHAARAMTMNLRKEGYKIFESSNPKEVLDAFHKVKPDAVVTSLRTSDQLQFLEQVSHDFPDVPIILLNSSDTSNCERVDDFGERYDSATISRLARLKNIIAKVIEEETGEGRAKLAWKWFHRECGRQRIIANTSIMLEMLQTINNVKDCSRAF